MNYKGYYNSAYYVVDVTNYIDKIIITNDIKMKNTNVLMSSLSTSSISDEVNKLKLDENLVDDKNLKYNSPGLREGKYVFFKGYNDTIDVFKTVGKIKG